MFKTQQRIKVFHVSYSSEIMSLCSKIYLLMFCTAVRSTLWPGHCTQGNVSICKKMWALSSNPAEDAGIFYGIVLKSHCHICIVHADQCIQTLVEVCYTYLHKSLRKIEFAI